MLKASSIEDCRFHVEDICDPSGIKIILLEIVIRWSALRSDTPVTLFDASSVGGMRILCCGIGASAAAASIPSTRVEVVWHEIDIAKQYATK